MNPTTQRWDSHDSALAIEDPVPHGGHSQSCSPPDLLSDDARAQEASASELNHIPLAQGTEDLHFLASSATTELKGMGGTTRLRMLRCQTQEPFHQSGHSLKETHPMGPRSAIQSTIHHQND